MPKSNSHADVPPVSHELTAYDLSHMVQYLFVLDCEAAGGDWRHAATEALGIDPDQEPERARLLYDTHLARAQWMTQVGYQLLLRPQ